MENWSRTGTALLSIFKSVMTNEPQGATFFPIYIELQSDLEEKYEKTQSLKSYDKCHDVSCICIRRPQPPDAGP